MQYITYFVVGLLGVVFHCVFKLKDFQSYAKKVNVPFTLKDYVIRDWFGISLSFLSVSVWVFLFGEFANKYPKIIEFVTTSFFVMGWFGSYIIQKLYSKGKSYISDEIDKGVNSNKSE